MGFEPWEWSPFLDPNRGRLTAPQSHKWNYTFKKNIQDQVNFDHQHFIQQLSIYDNIFTGGR